MSQNASILEYLKAGNTLTGMDALRLFGTMKLASRISEIKREIAGEDFKIESAVIETENGKHVCKYWIEKKGLPVVYKEQRGQLAFM